MRERDANHRGSPARFLAQPEPLSELEVPRGPSRHRVHGVEVKGGEGRIRKTGGLGSLSPLHLLACRVWVRDRKYGAAMCMLAQACDDRVVRLNGAF